MAIKLAKKFNAELVSADSRQVYRGMDIGTGKDLKNKLRIENACLPARQGELKIEYKEKRYEFFAYDMGGVPLWMYDVVNPDEEFSVAHYQYLARQVINDIHKRGKLVIIVGGTGLYIKSLLHPITTADVPPNLKLRQELETKTLEDLQKLLQQKDPHAWISMNYSDRQNPRRLIRKIEIAFFVFPPHLPYFSNTTNLSYDVLVIGLTTPLSKLYGRIDKRVDERVKAGIIKEIQGLLKQGYSWELSAMSATGYREWKQWFMDSGQKAGDRKINIIQRWKWDEHGIARRQMTWFKKQANIVWFDTVSDILAKVEKTVYPWYTDNNQYALQSRNFL